MWAATSQKRTFPPSCPLATVRPSALNAMAVIHASGPAGCSMRRVSCPPATSHRMRSSLPLARTVAFGLKHHSVSMSLRKCRASSLPSAAQCRSTPSSSMENSVPSAANATAAMSPSVWNRGSPNTRSTSGDGRTGTVSSE